MVYWGWTAAHAAQTSAESWRQARWLVGVGILAAALLANAVAANLVAATRGAARGWASGLLAGWFLVAAAATWWLSRR